MVTYDQILTGLRAIGLPSGRHLLVNCAMSRIGRLHGGPATLLRALREVIGEATVVVPTQTANNSTTSRCYRAETAGMSPAERERYQASMPGFDPAVTPSYEMGALAEHVRQHHGAIRSAHPQASFAAIGLAAAELMRVHDLDSHLGERSPLAALYATGATTLLLGVGVEKCTALHLAEHRLGTAPPMKAYTCFLSRGGQRVRCEFDAPDLDDTDFGRIGVELLRQPWARSGRVGRARAFALPVRQAVDFAAEWMIRHRSLARH